MSSFRVTTGMAMNTYRYNLQNSTKKRDESSNRVLTHRKFNSYAEDPASATHAWRLRRALSKTSSYTANNSDVKARINIAWTTLGTIKNKQYDEAATTAELRGRNDPTADGREPLGTVLQNTAESVIQAMNSAKYGDHFIFAGDDGLNPPFTWSDDMKTLYYRGINVNAGKVEMPESAAEPSWIPADANTAGMTEEDYQAWKDYYIHLTDEKPTTQEPNWVPSKPIYVDENAKEWSDYYKQGPGGTVQKPAGTEPTWIADGAAKAVADGKMSQADADAWVAYYADPANSTKPAGDEPDWIPASAEDRDTIAEGWVDYYNHETDEMPAATDASKATEPNWGTKDKYGVPKDMNDPDFKPANAVEAAWAAYYKDQSDVAHLDEMANEQVFVDLGMGLLENEKGNIVNGTAFDMSLPGIKMLGYGIDEDGDPKNGAMIMVRLGEILNDYNPETDRFEPPENEEEYDRLINKLKKANDLLISSYSDVDTKGQYLASNETRLKDQNDYLTEEILNLEQVDLADAITEFSWDYYCYSAALKIGTQLLSQSLIDYMR